MCTDFPFQVDTGTNNHAQQRGNDDAAHVAWQVNAIHCQEASGIAHDRNQVRNETFLSVPQFLQGPPVDFLKQVDAEHREQYGKTIYHNQHRQFILQGKNPQIGKEKEK